MDQHFDTIGIMNKQQDESSRGTLDVGTIIMVLDYCTELS